MPHRKAHPVILPLLVLLALVSATPSPAAHYEEETTICGHTWPYKRGDRCKLAPGFYATKNDKGAVQKLMEIKRPLTVSRSRKRMDLLADFLSAHEIQKVWMCIQGSYGEQPDSNPAYAIIPENFWFIEKAGTLLNPSEIQGSYGPEAATDNVDAPINISAIADDEVGLRFRFSDLAPILKTRLGETHCADLDKAGANFGKLTGPWLASLSRASKSELKTKLILECSNTAPLMKPAQGPFFASDGESLAINVRFSRSTEQANVPGSPTIQLDIEAEKSGSITVQFPPFVKLKARSTRQALSSSEQ